MLLFLLLVVKVSIYSVQRVDCTRTKNNNKMTIIKMCMYYLFILISLSTLFNYYH